MKEIASIPLSEEVNYYLIFYLFSFSIAFLIVFYQCVKNRKDLLFLCSITAAIFLAFVFGCKLMTVLESFFITNQNPQIYHNTQIGLGGVALSFIVVIILRLIFDIPGRYLYALGLAVLIGLMLEKPGCLFGGCCRGLEGSTIFSISYLDGAPRHPLQFYEMGIYLFAILVLRKIQVKDLASKYFIAVAFFCLVQFLSEFIKEPLDTLVFADNFLGIKMVQWIYLLLAMISLLYYYFIEADIKLHFILLDRRNIFSCVILLLTVVIVFLFIHPFLFRVEIYAINLALLPSVVFCFIGLFNYFTLPQYRWASVVLMLLPLFLMSQTVQIDTKEQQVFRTIGIGYSGGNFQNQIYNTVNPDGCDGDRGDFEQKYNLISIGVLTTKVREKSQFSYGINASFGGITETDLATNKSSDGTIISLNPFIMHDLKWFGIGVGLHIGSNYYALPKGVQEGNGPPDTGLGNSPIFPQGHVRVGPKRFFALEYNFANHFPSALPAFSHEMVLGSGFGLKNDFYVKYGTLFGSQTHYDDGSYVSAYIPIKNMIVLEPLIGFGTMKNVYMFGLSYRFGHKETEYTISNSNAN